MTRRRLLAVLVTALLVTATLPAGPVGTASAETAVGVSDDCDPSVTDALTGALGLYSLTTGCFQVYDTGGVNRTQTDANQTHIDIYQSAQNARANADLYQTGLENYLQDTRTRARIIGQNAYVRALNNGSSEPAARTAAKSAVADYYATKQMNLAESWDLQVNNIQYLESVASNESGLGVDQHGGTGYNARSAVMPPRKTDGDYRNDAQAEGLSYGSTSVSLVNGTSTSVRTVTVDVYFYDTEQSPPTLQSDSASGTVDVTTGTTFVDTSGIQPDPGVTVGKVLVTAPNSNYNDLTALRPDRYAEKWSSIQTQNQQVQAEMDTLVNNTYTEYQQGEINNSELVDPYVLASEYSPNGSYQSWAMAQLTTMGVNSPDALESTGHFNVTHNGTQYRGMLMSETNPQSGQFAVNQTYDPANITGQQYVVTDDRIKELKGAPFTVDAIENADGQRQQNVTIVEKQYQTANVTEMQQLYDELSQLRAEIEAREQRVVVGGGTGGGVPPLALLALLVLVVVGYLYWEYNPANQARRYR